MSHAPTYFVLLSYRHNVQCWNETDAGYSRQSLIEDMLCGVYQFAGIVEIREFDGQEAFRDVSVDIAKAVAAYETDVGATLPTNVRKFCEAHGVLEEAA